MSEEMKMADVFRLPVSKGVVERLDFDQCENFVSDGVAEFDAIAHAINSHDRLVDEVEAMRKALSLAESECKALYQHNFNLSLRNKQLEEKLADVWDVLYGKGFEVVGFHLNGDLEPMDSFFDNNDWNF